MGDRANIAVLQYESGSNGKRNTVILYTHSGGYSLPEDLMVALERGKNRWEDTQYLSRIIFCQMVGKDFDGTTGYGITTQVQDNSYPILVVDPGNGKVYLADEQDLYTPTSTVRTFQEYVDLGDQISWEVLEG